MKRAITAFIAGAFVFCLTIPGFADEPVLPLLTNLTQVRLLPQSDAQKGYPVEISAVVTCFDPAQAGVFLYSDNESIYSRHPGGSTRLRAGDRVILKGSTIGSPHHNFLTASQITIVSNQAPLPTPIVLQGDRLQDVSLDSIRAVATATVERVRIENPKWVFDVRQNGRRFLVQLSRPPRVPLDSKDWVGARVEFTGPASIRDNPTDGAPTRLFCQSIEDLRIVENPAVPRAVPIGELSRWVRSDQWLSISGRASAVSAALMTVEDDTGEIAIPALRFARIGDELDVTGFAVNPTGKIGLAGVQARLVERDAAGNRRGVITSVAQLRALSPTEADQQLPVRIRGVATYCEAGSTELFLQDGPNGVFVWMEAPIPGLAPGLEVEVFGKSGGGLFAPIIESAKVTLGRRVDLPVARQVTFSDLLSGKEDAGLVEIAGVVRGVYSRDSRAELKVATAGGELTVRMACSLEIAKRLEHALARFSGVASGHFNERRQITAALMLVPDLDSVQVDEAAPVDPFSVKRVSLHDVFRFRADRDASKRVLVSGIVAWQAPGGGAYLVDGDETLFVNSPPVPGIVPGAHVEAVGYPALGVRFSPILNDSIIRMVGTGSAPRPRVADMESLRNGSLDASLVKIRARLIEGYENNGVWKSTWRTEHSDGLIFDALLGGKLSMTIEPDTVADLTGVVRTLMNDERKAAGLELNLRSSDDMTVVSLPAWWTPTRFWGAAMALVIVLAGSVGWVIFLRHKVDQQTALVKAQLTKEEKLQKQYRDLFDNNPHPMWVYDLQTLRFLAVNETAVQRYGYSRKEFLSMNLLDIRSSEERDRLLRILTETGNADVDGSVFEHQRKDGSRLIAEITTREILFGAEPAKLVLALDVTERLRTEKALRLSEAKFRRVVESSLIGVIFFDDNGVITDANDSFLVMVGRTREELRAGSLKSIDFAPLGRVERHKAAMQDLRDRRSSPPTRREFLRSDGTIAPAMVGAVALDDNSGYVAFVLDLTKENALEQQVVLAQKMEAVGLLAGGVAHDFNNLLQVIQGYTLLSLDSAKSDPELSENLQQVSGAAERAAELTRQLLVFSRQENLKESLIDLGETLRETLKLVRRVIGEHIEVQYSAAPDLAGVRADKGRIEQVLMNLCLNARDAMPKGGKLSIELFNATLTEGEGASVGQISGEYVCLRVTDTGCGMDAATLARIYEPFFTTKTKDKGSGLGLSIVYGIVERHKGVIRVHSKVSAGTTFLVYFPAASTTDTRIITKQPKNADTRGMETILLVEDEPAVRTLAARVLQRAGYEVRIAADGAEACDVFQRHAPDIDLVLMDVIMPKMGGRDAYEKIVKTRKDIPVIFCSGYSERELGADFLQSHGLDLLPKPYRPDELLTRIRERLHPTKDS